MTVVVSDQEEAPPWYTEKLGFEKRTDETPAAGIRGLTAAPENQKKFAIVPASSEWSGHSQEQIGKGDLHGSYDRPTIV